MRDLCREWLADALVFVVVVLGGVLVCVRVGCADELRWQWAEEGGGPITGFHVKVGGLLAAETPPEARSVDLPDLVRPYSWQVCAQWTGPEVCAVEVLHEATGRTSPAPAEAYRSDACRVDLDGDGSVQGGDFTGFLGVYGEEC